MLSLSRFLVILVALAFLQGCSLSPDSQSLSQRETISPLTLTKIVSPTQTITPKGATFFKSETSPIPSPTTAPFPTPTLALQICSPLENISIPDLSGAISNPYNPPPPGSDYPHEGVDLAILNPGTGIAIKGAPVKAIMPGQIAAIINNRFPYGNAIIIETRISDLPPAWVTKLLLPSPIPTLLPHPALTCPKVELNISLENASQSIYLVYAHLEKPIDLKPGERVECCQQLGTIGDSGNALNPHLHLEARLGPSGTRFPSMSHYDSSATPEEMATYCVWRVSGLFLLFDPMSLFLTQP